MAFTKIQTGITGNPGIKNPMITISKGSVAINAELYYQAKEPKYVAYYLDGTKLLLVFSDKKLDGTLKITHNEGKATQGIYAGRRTGGTTSADSLHREIDEILTSYKWQSGSKYEASEYNDGELSGWIVDLRKPINKKK